MQVSYVTVDYTNNDGTTETLIGPADSLGDAHAMIITHIEAERAVIKEIWYAHFDAEWPGEHHVIELTQNLVGNLLVVTYNHSDVCWYQIVR